MPRYIGYEFTGTANSTVVTGDNYFNSTTLLLHFDGDVTDATGNYSPTTNTSTSETTIVKYGSGSRRFNNTKLDYASTLLDFGSADWTVEGWVYWDGTAGYGGIVINSSSTSWNDGINFYNNGSTIGLFTPSITTTISSGQWYHFAIVRESGVWAWWLDGSRVGTATAGFTDTGATSSFGFHSAVSQYPFYGYLDDIRVTDGVARYNTASTSISVPTQAYLGEVTDRKYNSGVWAINGTDESSVYGRRIEGNWLTTTRDDPFVGDVSIEYLVVGGAGGGAGGGGGAGEYLTNFGIGTMKLYSGLTSLGLFLGTTYTVTVGAGGAFGTNTGSNASKGADSSLSGADIATVTAEGGGYGAGAPSGRYTTTNGGAGGSGGGAASWDTGGGAGTGGSSNTGGNDGGGCNDGGSFEYNAGGGGGSASAGTFGTGPDTGLNGGAFGGAGTSNSITGSSVTYAAGGDGYFASGGSAGGANTGDGGDGRNVAISGGNGFAGGSGVVILRMLTSQYSGTTTGSPNVTTDGAYTVLEYTSSGSYTA